MGSPNIAHQQQLASCVWKTRTKLSTQTHSYILPSFKQEFLSNMTHPSSRVLRSSAALAALAFIFAATTRAAESEPSPLVSKSAQQAVLNQQSLPSITIFTPDFKGDVPDVLKNLHSSQTESGNTGAALSEFDNRYFNQATANLVIDVHQEHDLNAYVGAVRQAAQSFHETSQHARVSTIKVAASGRVLFLTATTPQDEVASRAVHQQSVKSMAALHSAILECHHGRKLAVKQLQPSIRRLAEVLSLAGRHPSTPACEGTQQHTGRQLIQPRFSIAYPTADYRMDHALTARRLQSQHPGAIVHTRKLPPPIISNPVLMVARKTLPVYTLEDGSSRYRMLAEASHPAHGNITIGYDVLVRPESLSLDDAGEVISVYCEDSSTMRVSALHPLPISAPETVLEGAKEWGCALKGGSAQSFVVSVRAVSSTVLSSGIIEYTMEVHETVPFSAASIWDSVIIMHPPSPEVLASEAEKLRKNGSRALSVACAERTTTLASGNGYALLDCEAETGEYGNYNFNYNRATGRAVAEKLYLDPGSTNVWFENTYAFWTTVIELRMAFYAGVSGFGLPLFEVILRSSVGASAYLKAALRESSSTSQWSALTNTLNAGSFSLPIGVIPFNGAATVQLVARKSQASAGNVQFETGASASASAWVGLRYEAKLEDPSDRSCYCVSTCSSNFASNFCFVNEGCLSASAPESGTAGFKWKYCSGFGQASSFNTWNFVHGGTWDMSYTPPTITSGSSSVNPGRLQYHLGAKLGLTLYSLIPLYTVLYWELNVDVSQASQRSLRQPDTSQVHGWGRELLVQCGGASGDKTGQIDFGVGDVAANMGVDDVKVSLAGFDYTLARGASVADVTVQPYSENAGQLPVCAQAAPIPVGGGVGSQGGGGGGVGGSTGATSTGGSASNESDDSGASGGMISGAVIGVVAVVAVVILAACYIQRRKASQAAIPKGRTVEAPVTPGYPVGSHVSPPGYPAGAMPYPGGMPQPNMMAVNPMQPAMQQQQQAASVTAMNPMQPAMQQQQQAASVTAMNPMQPAMQQQAATNPMQPAMQQQQAARVAAMNPARAAMLKRNGIVPG